MKRLTQALVRQTIPDWQRVERQEVRSRYGALGGWASILVNVLLFVVKLVLGLLTRSLSLVADAFHTLSDVATSIVIVASFRMAKKPADAEHPFGHGRMEAVATLVVAVMLIIVGLELGKGAVGRISHPAPFDASWAVTAAIAVTIVVKELLARFARELGRMIGSSALEADFWHHRIDAVSSILVIGAFVGARFGLGWLDGVMGLGVSAMIVWTGWHIVRDGINDLLGRRPKAEWVADIKSVALGFPGVLDVHDLIIHQYGTQSVMSVHVAMDERLSFKEAHRLGSAVGSKIDRRFHTHTTVHLDPVSVDDPELDAVRQHIFLYLETHRFPMTVHDLKLSGSDRQGRRVLHLHVRPSAQGGSVDRKALASLIEEIKSAHAVISDVTVDQGPEFLF